MAGIDIWAAGSTRIDGHVETGQRPRRGAKQPGILEPEFDKIRLPGRLCKADLRSPDWGFDSIERSTPLRDDGHNDRREANAGATPDCL